MHWILNARYLMCLLNVAVKLAVNISYKLKVGTQTDGLSNCITSDDARRGLVQRKKLKKNATYCNEFWESKWFE